jgi:hypothetical protein
MVSNKKFGYSFCSLILILSFFYYVESDFVTSAVLFLISILLVIVTFFYSHLLSPLNIVWYKLGLLLGTIVSPVILGIIFFAFITPVSLITRFFGRDTLFVKRSKTKTYWIKREPEGPQSESYKNQF